MYAESALFLAREAAPFVLGLNKVFLKDGETYWGMRGRIISRWANITSSIILAADQWLNYAETHNSLSLGAAVVMSIIPARMGVVIASDTWWQNRRQPIVDHLKRQHPDQPETVKALEPATTAAIDKTHARHKLIIVTGGFLTAATATAVLSVLGYMDLKSAAVPLLPIAVGCAIDYTESLKTSRKLNMLTTGLWMVIGFATGAYGLVARQTLNVPIITAGVLKNDLPPAKTNLGRVSAYFMETAKEVATLAVGGLRMTGKAARYIIEKPHLGRIDN